MDLLKCLLASIQGEQSEKGPHQKTPCSHRKREQWPMKVMQGKVPYKWRGGSSCHDCHALKEELTAVSATEELLGATVQPETSLSNTPTYKNAPGEGATFKWHATKACCPKPQKPPNLHEILQESEGVLSALGNVPVIHGPLGLAAMAENANLRKLEPLSISAHK
jgi:hypothetical protein